MSPEVCAYIAAHITGSTSVLEYGAVNINGSARAAAPETSWHGIDLVAGDYVDEVADAATYVATQDYDCIVCCEVLEHTAEAAQIVETAYANLIPGGRFLMTCASVNRLPHSAYDGGQLREDEYYRNVTPAEYQEMAERVGFVITNLEYYADRGDLYATGIKPL